MSSIFSPFFSMIILYCIILFGIGMMGYYKTSNLSDYILGGRKIGWVVTALSTGASDMSGWLLMGLPGAIFTHGVSQAWIVIGLCLGAWVNWSYIAAKIRSFTESYGNAQTLPEYFAKRFPQRGLFIQGLSAFIILIFFTIYCSSGIVAAARLFQMAFSIDYTNAVFIGTFITVFYVMIGGFFAVSWTDTFQAGLMLIALLVVPIYTFGNIDLAVLFAEKPHDMIDSYFSIFKNMGWLPIVSALSWGLGYFGQPHILVRFMAAADAEATIKNARIMSMTWMIMVLFGSVCVGLLGALYYLQHDLSLNNPENIFMELSKLLFNPWISGFLFAAVLSAIMSTLSCQLLLCSSAIVRDLLPLFKVTVSPKKAVHLGRITLFLIAILAMIIALSPESSILTIVSYAWAGFGCTFGPLILFSLYSKQVTADAAILGMMTGAMIVLFGDHLFGADVYVMIPGFIGSCFTIWMVSVLQKNSSTQVN